MFVATMLFGLVLGQSQPVRDVGFPQWHTVQTQDATGKWSAINPRWMWGISQNNGMIRPVSTPPTVPPPATLPTPVENFANLGVDRSRLSKTGEKYRSSGPESSRFIEQVQGNNLVDDSRKFHMVVIGTPDEQASVRARLDSVLLKDLVRDFHVSYRSPDDWSVKGQGFDLTGHPSIMLELPEGQAVWQAKNYPGDEAMVRGISETKGKLRNPDPNFDPSKVSGPNGPAPSISSRQTEWGLAVVLAVAGFLLIRKGFDHASD
jgi:hypothetical protein